MKNCAFIYLLFLLSGCSVSNVPKFNYAGQEIPTHEEAKKYEGISVNQLASDTYQIFIVSRVKEGWEVSFKNEFFSLVSNFCGESFQLIVNQSDIHGAFGADLPDQWMYISQEATLKCKSKPNKVLKSDS